MEDAQADPVELRLLLRSVPPPSEPGQNEQLQVVAPILKAGPGVMVTGNSEALEILGSPDFGQGPPEGNLIASVKVAMLEIPNQPGRLYGGHGRWVGPIRSE